MAIPTQGGLNQVSAQPKPPAQPAGGNPAGGKFDVNVAQANNLDKIATPNPLKNFVSDELEDQREALNTALARMRASLDDRKNRRFDPVLMQAAAGFLKPTKTGSFGESLGYAAENAGVAADRESVFEKENQKMEMELLAKEQELRRQMGSDRFLGALVNRGRGNAPAPAGGAVATPTGALRVPGTGSPVDLSTAQVRPPTVDQVIDAAKAGRIVIDDETILMSKNIDPKLPEILKAIRENQLKEDTFNLERDKFEGTTRPVKPLGLDTERQMDRKEYAEYQRKLDEANTTNDEQILLQYYKKKGWLEKNQLGENKPPKEGEPPAPIPRAKSQAELDAEKEAMTERQKIRAKASEEAGNMVLDRGRNSINMESLATDVLSLTDSNAKAFNLMQNATVRDAVLRAVEQGADIGVGPMSVRINLPVRVALQGNKQYELTKDDIAALQLFQQKQSAITAEMRKMARTPGEGATDRAEGQLYAAIGILPTDSTKVLALKSEAMIQRARYDARAAELWSKFQEDNPNKSFTYFQNSNPEFRELQKNYVRTLNEMREKNADTLRSPKNKPASETAPASAPARPATAPAAPVSTAPAPTTSAPSQPPANETYSQRLKRLQAEEDARKKAQRGG
jgi:hypothetical protein